jgi:hypothetical protein
MRKMMNDELQNQKSADKLDYKSEIDDDFMSLIQKGSQEGIEEQDVQDIWGSYTTCDKKIK